MRILLIIISALLILTTPVLAEKLTKDTKKIDTNICEEAIKKGRVLGFFGSPDSNIRFILEYTNKLYRYSVNKHWAECWNIDEQHN